MSWRWSGTSLLLLAGAACLTTCAVYVWRYRRSPTATSLVAVLLATTWWSLVYAAELAAHGLAAKQLLGDLKYIGLCTLPPAALIFVLQYAGACAGPARCCSGCWRSSRW
jgi:N-terminal 7TM region of histidine kinase